MTCNNEKYPLIFIFITYDMGNIRGPWYAITWYLNHAFSALNTVYYWSA